MKTKELINVHDNHKGMFNTRTGLLVDILNPTEEMICSEDIAHALNNVCRFGGHTHGHYSVAQHSILVAALAPDDMKLEALLHDASEAYLGDVIKPLKNILGSVYRDLEISFETLIGFKYRLDPDKLREIKQFDKQALEMEHSAYIDDDLSTYGVIYTIMESEIGRDFKPYEIPGIFIELLNLYRNDRNTN